jgi:transcriptional regulator with XRE-family HTH domain
VPNKCFVISLYFWQMLIFVVIFALQKYKISLTLTNNSNINFIIMNFSLIFKDLRREKKITQLDFANKLSVSRSAIAQIESSNNNPSRDLVLKLLEVFDVSSNLRQELERYIKGDKGMSKEEVNYGDLSKNDKDIVYNKGDVWSSYAKLVENKKNILCLCIFLKEVHSYEFNEEEKSELRKVEFAIGYLDNYILGRVQVHDRLFKRVLADLQDSNDLIEYFSNKILPHYSTRIRDFEDLYIPKEYEDLNDSF